MASTSKLFPLRRTLWQALRLSASPSSSIQKFPVDRPSLSESSVLSASPHFRNTSRSFSSGSSHLDEPQSPATIDYSSLMQENEYHKLADSSIHDLLEKIEEYGDSVDVDGFDIDYGNEVLTIKLGNLGTYVINKQTPNRQIWMSSPVSGPSRFDWDPIAQAWIYRRTKANLLKVLETELAQLCGSSINLSEVS